MFRRLRGMSRAGVVAGIAVLGVALAGTGASGAVRSDSGPTRAAANGVVKVRVLGLGNVTSDPAGITCGPNATCQASFPIGTRLTLNTSPGSPGWVFHIWDPTGPCAGAKTGPTCIFNVSSSFQEVAPLFVGLTLKDISFGGKWTRSLLVGGTLTVSGLVSHISNLVVTTNGPTKRTFPLSIPAGDFQQTFKLPKTGFLPGSYNVTVSGTVTGHPIPPQTLAREFVAPKEGVVSRAWVSAFGGSAPVSRLPASALGATAHFVFAANPFKGSAVTTTWFRNKKKVFGPVGKPRTKNVTSFIGVRGGHLASGFYTCVLKARGLVVKQVGIQVG
jgi:hypothetical protein